MKELGAKRIHQLLKEGRHELKFLKRANLGDLIAVEKVLQLTYGRTGKRKHNLLAVWIFFLFDLTVSLITMLMPHRTIRLSPVYLAQRLLLYHLQFKP